jgi:hypothetical protein
MFCSGFGDMSTAVTISEGLSRHRCAPPIQYRTLRGDHPLIPPSGRNASHVDGGKACGILMYLALGLRASETWFARFLRNWDRLLRDSSITRKLVPEAIGMRSSCAVFL